MLVWEERVGTRNETTKTTHQEDSLASSRIVYTTCSVCASCDLIIEGG